MIDKKHISQIVEEYIAGTDFFLVDVKISAASKITVLFDGKSAGIKVDDCARLSKHIESRLDRNREDFELQVSSPGLEMPFLVLEQYEKNQGKKVEVIDIEGKRHTGTLKNVTEGGFELESEGELSFNFDQVKTVKTVIAFK
jgi:ribosome maturation factor RimP